MTNLLIVGDIHITNTCHVRKDNYWETLHQKLWWIVETANAKDAIVVQLGDIIDSPKIHHSLLHEFMDVFSTLKNPWFFLIGNHDINSNSNHWLDYNELISWLKIMPNAKPLCGAINIENIHCYGSYYQDTSHKLPPKVPCDIIFTHEAYDVKERVVNDSLGLKTIIYPYPTLPCKVHINGHIHAPSYQMVKIGNTIHMNPGAITRLRRDEDVNRKPSVILLECNNDNFKPSILTIPYETDVFITKEEKVKDKEWFQTFSKELEQQQSAQSSNTIVEHIQYDITEKHIEPPVGKFCIQKIQEVSSNG